MARLQLRIDFGPEGALGPGKIALLERIDECGSIAAAGRTMGMSYKRAWNLIDSLQSCFREPLVVTRPGGPRGGGTALTPFGRDVVRHYRAMERKAAEAAAGHLAALEAALGERQ